MKLTVLCVVASLFEVIAWNNGAALTPPMGFANWNLFGCNYDDALFREMADAMVSTGLAALGFKYMLVQECIVPAGNRDPQTGVLQPDPVKFPFGLANLTAYFHEKGLLAGIYTDVAWRTCANYEGSGPGPSDPVGHWPLDALTFAQWGFDMIEADFCNTQGVNLSAYELYKAAHDAIGAASAITGRTVALYQCNWGVDSPWLWAPEVANLFRNTGDICGPGSISWERILSNFDNTVVHSSTPPARAGLPGTGIGAWNDPDMIGVGMPGITDVEGRSQFSLWCILGAPLFLGTDVRNMSAATAATLGNAEAVAINQDPLGVQGYAFDMGIAPSSYSGGTMLNLTTCTFPPSLGSMWILNGDGHIANANNSDCLTIVDCDNTPGSVVFAYGCVTDACSNELFTWDAQTGQIKANVTPAPPSPLCITAVDPTASPFSQAIVDTCDGRNAQKWTWGADGTLSASVVSGGPALCLTEPIPDASVYVKPLAPSQPPGASRASQPLAIAILNRDSVEHVGYTFNLTSFSFAPASNIMVRDVWAGTTSGPFSGSFTTRAAASHETLLLKLFLA